MTQSIFAQGRNSGCNSQMLSNLDETTVRIFSLYHIAVKAYQVPTCTGTRSPVLLRLVRRLIRSSSVPQDASQRFPPPQEHPTHPPSEGGAAAAASTPQHARICHSAIVSIPVASRQDTAVAGVRTPSIHENPHSLLIVSAGKTPPTCDEIVDLRHSACGHNECRELCELCTMMSSTENTPPDSTGTPPP